MRIFLISTWFQVLWFMAVLGQGDWVSWLVVSVVITFVLSCRYQGLPIWSCFSIAILGVIFDSVNSLIGVLVFDDQYIPVWLVLLWAGYAWFAFQLYPLIRDYLRGGIIFVGAIAGGLSYYAGEQLGAVMFGFDPFSSVLVLMIEWAIVIWVTLKVYDHGNQKIKYQL